MGRDTIAMDRTVNIVKVSSLSKLTCKFSAISIQIPADFLARSKRLIKHIHENIRDLASQNSIENDEQSWGTHAMWRQDFL
jgi:hypothetical protein